MIRLVNQMIEYSNPIDVIGLSDDWSAACSLYLMMSSVVSDRVDGKSDFATYRHKKKRVCALLLFIQHISL